MRAAKKNFNELQSYMSEFECSDIDSIQNFCNADYQPIKKLKGINKTVTNSMEPWKECVNEFTFFDEHNNQQFLFNEENSMSDTLSIDKYDPFDELDSLVGASNSTSSRENNSKKSNMKDFYITDLEAKAKTLEPLKELGIHDNAIFVEHFSSEKFTIKFIFDKISVQKDDDKNFNITILEPLNQLNKKKSGVIMNKISGYAKLQKNLLIKVVLFSKKNDGKITTMKYLFGKPYPGDHFELKGYKLENTTSFMTDSNSGGRLSNDNETQKASTSPKSKKTSDVTYKNNSSDIKNENGCLNQTDILKEDLENQLNNFSKEYLEKKLTSVQDLIPDEIVELKIQAKSYYETRTKKLGRRLNSPEVESFVIKLIIDKAQSNKEPITRKAIQSIAREITGTKQGQMMVNMKLGKGWLDKFIKRNEFQLDYLDNVIKKLQAEGDREQLCVLEKFAKLSGKSEDTFTSNQSCSEHIC